MRKSPMENICTFLAILMLEVNVEVADNCQASTVYHCVICLLYLMVDNAHDPLYYYYTMR